MAPFPFHGIELWCCVEGGRPFTVHAAIYVAWSGVLDNCVVVLNTLDQ